MRSNPSISQFVLKCVVIFRLLTLEIHVPFGASGVFGAAVSDCAPGEKFSASEI